MLHDAGADAEAPPDGDDLDFEQFKSPQDTWQVFRGRGQHAWEG